MRAIIITFVVLGAAAELVAEDVPPAAEYSRPDSPWRPGVAEPPLSVNKAFESASQIQQAHPGKFSWCLEEVRIPATRGKGGMLYYSYEFLFSRLVRIEPTVQREECVVTVSFRDGKVSYSDIKPSK